LMKARLLATEAQKDWATGRLGDWVIKKREERDFSPRRPVSLPLFFSVSVCSVAKL
jgi:hypothetical protein